MGEEIDSESSSRLSYASVRRDGFEYNIGDCCYLSPEAFGFSVKPATVKKQKADKKLVRPNAPLNISVICKEKLSFISTIWVNLRVGSYTFIPEDLGLRKILSLSHSSFFKKSSFQFMTNVQK